MDFIESYMRLTLRGKPLIFLLSVNRCGESEICMKQSKQYILPVASLVLALAVWELGVRLFAVPAYVLPAPSAVLSALVTDFCSLWMHSMVTLQEAVWGLLIAAALAVFIAIAMDLNRTAYMCLFPYLVVTQTVPVMVLGPLFTIWFGFGLTPKILMVVFMCFFPVVISLTDALRNTDPNQMNLLRSFGASKLQQYVYCKLPAAATALFSGLKVSATYCIGGAIVGEWLSASAGLGYYMIRLKNGFMMDRLFACVLLVIIWSLILNGLVSLTERVLFPYKRKWKGGNVMKKIIALLMALILCIGVVFFVGRESGSSADGPKSVTLVLDYVPNTNHTGFYVARELGYYEEAGLDVTIIEPGDNDAATLCAVGKAEFAVTYQENVTYARAAAEPLPIRAIATIVQHNTSGFVFRPDSGIESPKDFEGKVYAGWQAPSEAAVLDAVMTKYGADFDALTMVGASGSGLDSMTNGIDIQWEFEGWSVINDRMKGYDVGYLPVNQLDSRLDYYTPLIITNEDMIANNPETVEKFAEATKRGYEYAIAHPDSAAEILGKVIPETDMEFLKESQRYLSAQYSLDSDTWGVMKDEVWDGYTQFMYEYGLIDSLIAADQQYTNEFIK